MSKLLTGLMEAERQRRQSAAESTLPSTDRIGAGHGVAESVATAMVSAEAASELEAERAAAELLDRRIEEEAAALAAAQRNERVAAELAAAAAARAAKDIELTRLTAERAAAERCAADRATAQLQAERAAEAAARSRAAAEKDAGEQTRRRIEQEADASGAAAQRLGSERVARAGQAARFAAESVSDEVLAGGPDKGAGKIVAHPSPAAAQDAFARENELLPAWGRLIAAVALSMAVGVTAGFKLGGSADVPAISPSAVGIPSLAARVGKPLSMVDEDPPRLRLDHELRAQRLPAPQHASPDP